MTIVDLTKLIGKAVRYE